MNIGDKVHWDDPDNGVCSATGTIIAIDGDTILIETEAGSEIEAPLDEVQLVEFD